MNFADKMYLAAMCKIASAKQAIKEMWEEEKGSTSTVIIEIVMIGMVLVLAFMFRKAIGGLFSSLWNQLVSPSTSGKPGTVSIDTMENPFQ